MNREDKRGSKLRNREIIAASESKRKRSAREFHMLSLQLDPASAQQNPQTAPLIRELVMFGVRAFPAARSLEDSFEHAFQLLMRSPPQPPQGGTRNVKSPLEI